MKNLILVFAICVFLLSCAHGPKNLDNATSVIVTENMLRSAFYASDLSKPEGYKGKQIKILDDALINPLTVEDTTLAPFNFKQTIKGEGKNKLFDLTTNNGYGSLWVEFSQPDAKRISYFFITGLSAANVYTTYRTGRIQIEFENEAEDWLH